MNPWKESGSAIKERGTREGIVIGDLSGYKSMPGPQTCRYSSGRREGGISSLAINPFLVFFVFGQGVTMPPMCMICMITQAQGYKAENCFRGKDEIP
jgi:hypothetical protein